MGKNLYILLLLFINSNTYAAFEVLWKGYQRSNLNESRNVEKEIIDQDNILNLSSRTWDISLFADIGDSNLQNLLDFQSQRTLTNTYGVGFTKETFDFGTFDFQIYETKYDLSFWNISANSQLTGDTFYEARYKLNYSYDFTNRSASLEEEVFDSQYQANTAKFSYNRDTDFFDFYNVYLRAKLGVFTYNLNKEFVKRAEKRVKIVSRRFNDGLSRKVDLIQARSNLLKQQESVLKAESDLQENLSSLEVILSRELEVEEFSTLTWKPMDVEAKLNLLKTNPDSPKLKSVLGNLNLLKAQVAQTVERNNNSLLLNLSYQSNAYSDNFSNAIDTSFNNGRDEKKIGLSYVIPFGEDRGGATKAKYDFQIKKNTLDYQNAKDEFKVLNEAYTTRVRLLDKAVQKSLKRMTLNKSAYKEMGALYLRGQATFDDVIRAEESLIQSELDNAILLSQLDSFYGNLAYVNGKISRYLSEYKD